MSRYKNEFFDIGSRCLGIEAKHPLKFVLEREGLRIHRLDLRDKGLYRCFHLSKDHVVTDVRQINVDILYPPVVLRHPSSEPAIKGKNLTLTCQADGNPPVHYEWLKEKMITEIIRAKVRVAESTETLVIPNFDQSDEGRYFCKISNPLGFKENYVDIQMLVPPKISLSITNTSLLENSTLNIICGTTGVPVPKISWTMLPINNNQTNDVKMDSLHERNQPGVSTIVIQRLKRKHAGKLTCKASNVAGTASSSATILVELVFISVKPEVKMELIENLDSDDEEETEKKFISVLCLGTGFPLPDLFWLQNNNKLFSDQNDKFSITHRVESPTKILSYLNISEVKSRRETLTNLSCLARNMHGNVSTYLEDDDAIEEEEIDYTMKYYDETTEQITFKSEQSTKHLKSMEKQTDVEPSSGVKFVVIVSIGCAFVIGLIVTAVLANCFIQREKLKKSVPIDSVFLKLQKPVIVSKNSPAVSSQSPKVLAAMRSSDPNDSLTKKNMAVKLVKKSPVSISTRESMGTNLNGYYKGDSVDDVIDQFASVSSDKLLDL
ncbi:hypothetical protein HELRODRAFT_173029 [Helobdella robusta]|uniref:Ig-like domain-containing protein n=1 Tax=Helobdella robusta TaxID=6412 RepID=T1F6A1_HELRO|nr:hypothetical protein HELRODRAFT_173029 [Helobdella robusta]ESO03983.1 hypothetical protein HELRODRAFT_173029 [Helobdella robusta]